MATNTTKIRELCGCGAVLDIESSYPVAERQAEDWRKNHQHGPDEAAIRENERLRAEITALRETLSTVRP